MLSTLTGKGKAGLTAVLAFLATLREYRDAIWAYGTAYAYDYDGPLSSIEAPDALLFGDSRAQMSGGGSLAGLMIGVLIAAIIAINVFIPVVNDAIANSNVSGTTQTILSLLGLFAALLVLVSLAGPLMGRVR